MAIRERDAAAARWTRLWSCLSSRERRRAALTCLKAAVAVPAAGESAGAALATRPRALSSPVRTWPVADRAGHLAGFLDVDSGRSPARALRHDTP
jgi:hypothetical protein